MTDLVIIGGGPAGMSAAIAAFDAVYPDNTLSTSAWWAILWGISIWFMLQRIIMVWSFCKYYKVHPMK